MTYHFSNLPHPVQRAARLMHDAGESAWLVGGATRDLLMGRPVKDFDFVIAGDGVAWARRIANELGGAFVPLDEERRIGRAVVRHDGKALWIDVARFRGEGDASGSTALEEDLALRDFTVNAIALEPISGETVDPTGGVRDLERRQLRAAGPTSFRDDPLRILRAVRLHATHQLEITSETKGAMLKAVPRLQEVAAERIREEWMQLLAPPGAMARIEMLDALGVLEVLLPELLLGKGVTQSPPHSHDVFGHNLLVLEAMEQLLPWAEGSDFWQGKMARFAEPMTTHLNEELANDLPRWLLLKHVALLHDIGKPATRSVGKDGRIHFYQHEVVGAEMIQRIMRRMTFATKAVQYATRVVRHHLRPLHLSNHLPPSNRAIYRYFRDTEDTGPDIALHSIADQRGKAFAEDREEVMEVVQRLFEAYFKERQRFVHPTPLLNGNEVMELTGQRGPIIGKILETLREKQAQGTVRTREEAERLVKGWPKGETSKRGKEKH